MPGHNKGEKNIVEKKPYSIRIVEPTFIRGEYTAPKETFSIPKNLSRKVGKELLTANKAVIVTAEELAASKKKGKAKE